MNSIYAILILGLTIGISAREDAKHNWDYGRRGPDVWRHDYKACAGMRQSPINIDPQNVEYDRKLKPLKLVNYDKLLHWNVSHNGHTVVVNKLDADNVLLSGSNFEHSYQLLQFHFHWGFNDYQGSEHYIGGEKFPLEMHLVHQSPTTKDITVVGVLFQLDEVDNPKLNPLMNAISHTNDIRNWKEMRLKLNSILPSENELPDYYRYNGSLTTPPCTEGVLWNVVKARVNISAHQLLSFRTNQIRSNYREPQRLYSRKVTASFVPARGANAKQSSELHVTSASNKPSINTFFTMPLSLLLALVTTWHYLINN